MANFNALVLLVAITITNGQQIADVAYFKNYSKETFPKDGIIGPFGNRIVGGRNARISEAPHQAYLEIYDASGNAYVCGGSLIAPDVILTAAHCLDVAKEVYVGLGIDNLGNFRSAQIYLATKSQGQLFLHPQWSPRQLRNDIALIKLSRNALLDSRVNTISLPTADMSDRDHFSGWPAKISGFGRTTNRGRVSSTLQIGDVKIEHLAICNRFRFALTDSHICTTFSGTGTCNGDSGGPLVVNADSAPTLIGVTSFGTRDCQARGSPNVFTNVVNFRDWIISTGGL